MSVIVEKTIVICPNEPRRTFGNESRTDPHLRGLSFTQFDTTLEKHNHVEGMDVMFRAEAFNLSNTVHFWMPDTNANDLTFGSCKARRELREFFSLH